MAHLHQTFILLSDSPSTGCISFSTDTLISALLNQTKEVEGKNKDAQSSMLSRFIAAKDFVCSHTGRISLSHDRIISALLNINKESEGKTLMLNHKY